MGRSGSRRSAPPAGAMNDLRTGGCLCGAIRCRIAAPPVEALYCLAASATGRTVAGPTVPSASFEVIDGRAAAYRSSAKVLRQFCAACGTPLAGAGRPPAALFEQPAAETGAATCLAGPRTPLPVTRSIGYNLVDREPIGIAHPPDVGKYSARPLPQRSRLGPRSTGARQPRGARVARRDRGRRR
jgi:hypothetical protein